MAYLESLINFPIASIDRVDEAEFRLSQSIAKAKILQVDDTDEFLLQMSMVNLDSGSLICNRYGVGTRLESYINRDTIHFVFGNIAPSKFNLGKRAATVSPKQGVVIPPDSRIRINRSAGSELLVLCLSYKEVLKQFEVHNDRHQSDPLVFDFNVDLYSGAGAFLRRTLNNLIFELKANSSGVSQEVILAGYSNLLVSGMLALHSGDSDNTGRVDSISIAPSSVLRAEEYMRAHLGRSISTADLLRICKCSQGALYASFRRFRGYTPMEFLKEQRLQAAWTELNSPKDTATVSSIASDCGFTHLGRFSSFYKNRFGELPSETIARKR